MHLTRCDRCEKELREGKEETYLLSLQHFDELGNKINDETHEEDLCPVCAEKIKKHLGVK